jgi:hypothetical protein
MSPPSEQQIKQLSHRLFTVTFVQDSLSERSTSILTLCYRLTIRSGAT